MPAAAPEWFAAQPWPLQAVEVVVVGDLIVYWCHRWSHSIGWLWAFHRVHHSSLSLDWLAAHREHPVDGLLTQVAMNLPALGVSLEGLAWLIVFRGVWAAFIHSNVRLPIGPLRAHAAQLLEPRAAQLLEPRAVDRRRVRHVSLSRPD